MTGLVSVLCIVLQLVCVKTDTTNKFIKDYFKLKQLKHVVMVTCISTDQTVKLYKDITETKQLQFNIYNIENPVTLSTDLFLYDYYKLGVVLDLKCNNSGLYLNKISTFFNNTDVFHETYNWLLLWGGNTVSDSTVKLFNTLNININAEITYADVSNPNKYRLCEVYNSGRHQNGTLIINHLGYWSNSGGFSLNTSLYKYSRRSDMSGVVLRCMIVVTRRLDKEKFTHYIESPVDTHIDSMNRFNFALLLHLKDIYKFSYKMMRTSSWGYSHNGTFDGMVGQLEQKRIDIGGSPIFFRLERAKVIDYTIQTWVSRPCFIFRHPKQRSSIFKIYSRPFDDCVWYCALAVIVIVISCLYFMVKCQNFMICSHQEASWSSASLFTLGAMFQQGHSSDLILMSGKIVIMTIFTFSILFYQFYSASIVSSLLMEAPKTIRTLEDLLESNLKAGVEDILYTRDYFKKTTEPTALKLYAKKISNTKVDNFFSPTEGLKKVKLEGFAFHVDIATGYKIIRETFSEREVCELSEIQLFPPQRMVAIVQKGSPFRKLVTYGLRKIAERGLMARQKSVWHEKKPPCVQQTDPSQFKVSIKEFSSALMVLALGMVVSLIILMYEITILKIRVKKMLQKPIK